MTEQETLLDLALNAVIEALRMNPDRYKIIYNSKYDGTQGVFDYSSTTTAAMPSSPIPQNRYYNEYHEKGKKTNDKVSMILLLLSFRL